MVHFLLAAAVLIALLGWNHNNKNYIRASFLILFIFAALRYMYGNDYGSYYYGYYQIKIGGESPYEGEWLFTLLNMICPDYMWVTVLTSAIFAYGVYRLITCELPYRYMCLGVFIFVVNPYLFLMNLSAIRQCMALMMFLLAVDAACRKKMFQYVLFIVLAGAFHKTAFLLLPLYFWCNTKKVKTLWMLGIAVVVLCVLFVVDLNTIAMTVAEWFDDVDYINYLEDNLQNTLRATLLTSLYFFYTLFNLPKLEGRPLVYAKLYLIGTMLSMFAFRLSMLTRIQMYFDLFSVVALPQIFMAVQKRGLVVVNQKNVMLTLWDCINKYVMPPLLVVVYILRYYSFFNNPMWESFTKYQTIFDYIFRGMP